MHTDIAGHRSSGTGDDQLVDGYRRSGEANEQSDDASGDLAATRCEPPIGHGHAADCADEARDHDARDGDVVAGDERTPRRILDVRQLFGRNIDRPKPLRDLGETAEDPDSD